MVAIALWKQIQKCFCQTFVEYMPLKGAYLLGKLVEVAQPDVLIPPSGRNISQPNNFHSSLWCET